MRSCVQRLDKALHLLSVLFPDSGEGPLVVSLLDGKIAALDQETGGRLWEYDTGQPLVSNKGTASRGNDSKATVFPGADGSLYAYHHKERSFEVQVSSHGQYAPYQA